MKRKLKINRETLRNLADESVRNAAGASGVVCQPSIVCTAISCLPQCTLKYSVCVQCQ